MEKKYPFKFLDNYSRDDTEIFFGRDEEIVSLYEMIFQTSILLVYGASGTGKTSLIQCGLAQKFDSHDWLSVFIRRGNNLNESLEKRLAEMGGTDSGLDLDWLDELSGEAESDKPEISPIQQSIRNIYQNSFKPVYLIFDQFEELYILGNKIEQEQFITTVQEILEMKQPVKLIFSIREEYLGHLFDFEKAVPQLLRKKLRVEPMNIDKVQQVISGVTSFEQTNIHINEGQLDAVTNGIFEKLKAKNKLTIQLPYLQVFLDKLYLSITSDTTRQADATFTTDALYAIGDIDDVLSDFLEDQVKTISQELKGKYPDIKPRRIWEILSPFASLEGTKVPTSKPMLYDRLLQVERPMIDEVVDAFVKCRILRVSNSEDLYEIAHDSLAGRIADKRSDEEIALLEVHRLIKSQTSIKEEARELFTEKQLAFISPFIDKLHLSPEEQTWIDKSQEAVEYKKNEELRLARAQAKKEREEQEEKIRVMREEQERLEKERLGKIKRQRKALIAGTVTLAIVIVLSLLALRSSQRAKAALNELRKSQFNINFQKGEELQSKTLYREAIEKFQTALQFDPILGDNKYTFLNNYEYLKTDSLALGNVQDYIDTLNSITKFNSITKQYESNDLTDSTKLAINKIKSSKSRMDSKGDFVKRTYEADSLWKRMEYIAAINKYIDAHETGYAPGDSSKIRLKINATLKIWERDTVDYGKMNYDELKSEIQLKYDSLKVYYKDSLNSFYNNYK